MSSALERKNLIRAVFVCGWLYAGLVSGVAAADEYLVYSARYDGVAPLSDSALANLALEKGSVEWLQFDAQGALLRSVLRFGEPGIGYPGYTSMTRVEFESGQSAAKTVDSKDGYKTLRLDKGYFTMEWRLPKTVGSDPFQTVVSVQDKELYRETRLEEVSGDGVRPVQIRVDYGKGGSLIQVFRTVDGTQSAVNAAATVNMGGEATSTPVNPKGDPGKAAQSQLVQFTAPPKGLDLGFDSGWWPNGKAGGYEPEPGGFPVQVRIKAVAVASYQADVQGFFSQENNWLTAGNAAGSWGYDFGAELLMKAAFDLGFIDPFEVDIPYIPDINMRTTASDNFASFLLDSTSTLHDDTPRTNLFNVDLVSAILKLVGVTLPSWLSWIPFSAGAGVDVSIIADGDLTCDTISLTEGKLIWSEGQSIPIEVPEAGYSSTASYNEICNLLMTLDFYPTVFISIFGARYDLPIMNIPWKPFNGPLDLEFSQAPLNFTGEPPVGDVTDWFSERFVVNNDLAYHKMTLIPVNAPNGYVACDADATEYPTNPLGSTALSLGDDAFVEVPLSDGKQVVLYGQAYNRFFVGSNGYITFTQGDSENGESDEAHFNMPRISGVFDNLKPNDGGEISWKQLEDRAVVTFDQVRVDGNFTKDTVSFQIEMFFDGTISITWLTLETFDGMSGISKGGGIPSGYKESDLSEYAPCITEEGEGSPEGSVEGSPEGVVEGEGEGSIEGGAEGEGEGMPAECPQPCAVSSCGSASVDVGLASALTALYTYLAKDATTEDWDANGMVDLAQLQVLDVVLGSPGIQNRCCELMAWQSNYAVIAPAVDAAVTAGGISAQMLAEVSAAEISTALTGMATVAEPSLLNVLGSIITSLHLGVTSDMLDLSSEQYLASDGDADTDGVCNLAEYNAIVTGPSGFLTFVIAAIDPSSRQNGGGCGAPCYSQTQEGEEEGQGQILSVTAQAEGNATPVTVTLSPENSAGLDAGKYYIGTSVSARVVFNAQAETWLGWEMNGAPVGLNNPLTFSVTQDTALVAKFSPILAEGEGQAEGEGVSEGEGAVEGVLEGEGEIPGPEILVLPFVLEMGPVAIGQCVEASFIVTNSAIAGEPLIGTASIPVPFQIVSGSPYNLQPGQSQEVVVRFCPTEVMKYMVPIFFTGGAGAVHPVNGEGIAAPEGEGTADGEGMTEGEGASEGEGVADGEGVPEGSVDGATEGEGAAEGEGVLEGEGEEVIGYHSADNNPADWQIQLTELLRVIQFFNLRGFYCAPQDVVTEDGYLPGVGEDHSCHAHSSDYNPQDWSISLTELLRLIQFFNLRGYHIDALGEDGYVPGLPTAK